MVPNATAAPSVFLRPSPRAATNLSRTSLLTIAAVGYRVGVQENHSGAHAIDQAPAGVRAALLSGLADDLLQQLFRLHRVVLLLFVDLCGQLFEVSDSSRLLLVEGFPRSLV